MVDYLRAAISDAQVVFEVRYSDTALMCSQMLVKKPGNFCSLINLDSSLSVTTVSSDFWSERERFAKDSANLGGDKKVCHLLGFRYSFIAEAIKYIESASNPELPARKIVQNIRNIRHEEIVNV